MPTIFDPPQNSAPTFAPQQCFFQTFQFPNALLNIPFALFLAAPLLLGSTLPPASLAATLFPVAPAPLFANPMVEVMVVRGSGARSELSRSRW